MRLILILMSLVFASVAAHAYSAKSVPSNFHGYWVQKSKGCNHEDVEYYSMNIQPDAVNLHEDGGQVIYVEELADGVLYVRWKGIDWAEYDISSSKDPPETIGYEVLKLSTDGTSLTRYGSGKTIYVRCNY